MVLSNKSARHQQIRRKLIGLRFVLRSDILVIEISTVVLLYARQGRGLKGLDPINNVFVELRISYLLARATNIKDLSAFELLTRGMDAKIKVERFRKAARGRIGPNLNDRLTVFYDTM